MDENIAIVSLTQAGKQSRIARFNKPFPRDRGEIMITELVERATAINATDDLLLGISELRLFGSMLDPEVEMVGDVDVAFLLYRKEPPPSFKWVAWNIQRANQAGREYLQDNDKMHYGEIEVKRLLRAGKSRISLEDMFHFDLLKPVPKFKVIFKADPSAPPDISPSGGPGS
jgi:hypothetical protein